MKKHRDCGRGSIPNAFSPPVFLLLESPSGDLEEGKEYWKSTYVPRWEPDTANVYNDVVLTVLSTQEEPSHMALEFPEVCPAQ